MKQIGRFSAGVVTCIAIIIIIALFDSDTAGLICIGLFCSVLLTAGLALLIILPIIYLIGWITIVLFKSLLKTGKSVDEKFSASRQEKEEQLTKNVVAIVGYLKKQENCLRDREEITKDLKKAGWGIETIDFAYEIIERQR